MRNVILKAVILLLPAIPAPAQQWSPPVRISQPGGGNRPQILAHGATLHVVYENARGYDKICYIRSTDGGETWGEFNELSERDGNKILPRIIIWNQRLMALWRQYFFHGVYRLNIGYSISTNSGVTWSSPQYVLETNWEYIDVFAASGFHSDVNVLFFSDAGPLSTFYALRSTNFGQDWSTAQQIFAATMTDVPDMASVGDIVHFSWGGRFDSASAWEVYYLRSTDSGNSWSENSLMSEDDTRPSYWSAIGAFETGPLKLTWMDFKYSPYISTGDILLRSSPDSGGSWGQETQITHNHLASTSDIAGNRDSFAIAWEDSRPENGDKSIYCAMSFDGGDTWSEEYWIDSDSNYSYTPAMAFSNGRFFIIWYDSLYSDVLGLYFSRWPWQPDAVDEGEIPDKFAGLRAYPNPFNAEVTITVDGIDKCAVEVFDITGRRVVTLQTENGRTVWEAKGISSGVYVARVVNGDELSSAIKLVYLR
jgi:hypothetical protein